MSLSPQGDIWECREESDVVDYFQNLLDKHRDQGVAKCSYEDLEITEVGQKGFFATVSWTMSDKDGKPSLTGESLTT